MTDEPRWNPTWSRFRWCGRWSCWLNRVTFLCRWGGNCAIGHAPVADPGGY